MIGRGVRPARPRMTGPVIPTQYQGKIPVSGFPLRDKLGISGLKVGLTTLGQPRLSEGAQPYPRQRTTEPVIPT